MINRLPRLDHTYIFAVIWLDVQQWIGTNQNILKWQMNNSWLWRFLCQLTSTWISNIICRDLCVCLVSWSESWLFICWPYITYIYYSVEDLRYCIHLKCMTSHWDVQQWIGTNQNVLKWQMNNWWLWRFLCQLTLQLRSGEYRSIEVSKSVCLKYKNDDE
jgi:hypothetical protein